MAEVCIIAAAAGHALPADVIDSNIAKTHVMPPYKTSMLLDYERQQSMEIDAILGNAVRAGQRLGVACPHLQLLYGLMQLRRVQIDQSLAL
jgi:2-dehydropantoate 2-reductase